MRIRLIVKLVLLTTVELNSAAPVSGRALQSDEGRDWLGERT